MCVAPLPGRHIAAFMGHEGVVKALLDAKANAHAYDSEHETPLHHAVHMNHVNVMDMLIRHGASTELRDKQFKTPNDRAWEAKVAREKPRPRRAEDVADYDEVYEPPAAPVDYVVVHSKTVAVRATPAVVEKFRSTSQQYKCLSDHYGVWTSIFVQNCNSQ